MDLSQKVPSSTKRASLKTTAAAVIALNAGIAMAVTCDPNITGSGNPACSLANSGSVVVEMGGSVAKITVPTGIIADSITVLSGGLIGTSAIAISVTNATLSGAISNSGTISGTQIGIKIHNAGTVAGGISNSGSILGNTAGIYASINSTVTGGIFNSGSISGNIAGIAALISTVTGGIFNSGTISGNIGIAAVSNSTVTGGISNSGSISGNLGIATLTSTVTGGISNNGTISAENIGINVNAHSAITGNISNSGTISGNATGILASNSTVMGGIFNSGTVTGNIDIKIANSIVTGGISNSGTISAGNVGILIVANNTVTGDIYNNGSISGNYGIEVIANSTIAGDISNNGTISANNVGIFANASTMMGNIFNSGSIAGATGTSIRIANSTVTGSISNSGSISGANGIHVATHSTVSGGVSNSGTISGGNSSIGIKVATTSTVTGGISNSGSISGGINVANNSTVTGGISNDGVISAVAAGIGLKNNNKVTGGIFNNGTISGLFGIAASHSTVTGGISNNGTISGNAGIYVAGHSTITGDISNSGTISGISNGIFVVDNSTITGAISNSGTISGNAGILVTGHSTVTDGISNGGTISGNAGILVAGHSTVTDGISNGGSISGNGAGIEVSGHSTVTSDLFNSGTISGGRGILVKDNSTVTGGISNSGIILVSNTGINVGSHSTVTGSISNGGTISGNNTGIYVSASTVTGGISNSGIIQGSTKAIFVDASTSTVDTIDILGKEAQIIGDVDATGSTVNITTGATFTSDGAFDVKAFDIASDALFNMRNEITVSGAVENLGTLSMGLMRQTISGNYTQDANGIYQIGAFNTESYGKLGVTNNITLQGTAHIDVQFDPSAVIHKGDTFVGVLSAGVSDTLAVPQYSGTLNSDGTFNVTDNSAVWKLTGILNGDNGVDLVVSMDTAGLSACQGTYCARAARTIFGQLEADNPIFAPYGTLETTDAFARAAAQATPELTNENQQVTLLATRLVRDDLPMWSRLWEKWTSSRGKNKVNPLHGKSTGDAMLSQADKVWVKPYGATMTQNQSNTVNGYTASVYGAMIGRDTQINEDWMLGGAFAAGGDNIRGKSALEHQSIHSAQYQGIAYTSAMLPYNFYFAGQGLVGYGDNRSRRVIPLYGSTASGQFNSWFTNISAQLGWSYALSDRLVVIPDVNASYIYINQSAYTESGSLMDLNVHANNNSNLVLGADVNAAYLLTTLKNQHDVTLTGHAGVAGNVLDTQPSTIASFVAGGSAFSTYGIQYNDAVFRGGVGLTLANVTSPFSINLNYDLQAGNNGYSGLYGATFKYKA